jgi:hypothetical protein
VVLNVLRHLLQHARRLVEVDWHCQFRQILPNAVLDNLPEGDFLFWRLPERKVVPFFE